MPRSATAGGPWPPGACATQAGNGPRTESLPVRGPFLLPSFPLLPGVPSLPQELKLPVNLPDLGLKHPEPPPRLAEIVAELPHGAA